MHNRRANSREYYGKQTKEIIKDIKHTTKGNSERFCYISSLFKESLEKMLVNPFSNTLSPLQNFTVTLTKGIRMRRLHVDQNVMNSGPLTILK